MYAPQSGNSSEEKHCAAVLLIVRMWGSMKLESVCMTFYYILWCGIMEMTMKGSR